MIRTNRSRVVGLAAVAVVTATMGPALASAASTGGTSQLTLPGIVPAWTQTAKVLGDLNPAQMLNVEVVLNYRNAAELNRFVRDVSTPGTKEYRHFLTGAQFNARFSPAKADIAKVQSWLKKSGLTTNAVSSSGVLVTAHGSAAVVAKALGTTFKLFDLAGEITRAPIAAATVPGSLKGIVAGITGLNSVSYKPQSHRDADPPAAFLNARPCSDYWDQKLSTEPKFKGKQLYVNPCGYTPKQVRGAYGLDKVKATGKGATVAIIDAYASPTIVQDLDTYNAKHGLPAMLPGQFTQAFPQPLIESFPELATNEAYALLSTEVNTVLAPVPLSLPTLSSGDPQGWSGEETLDVEAVHTMAPGANIVYYGALGDNNDLMDIPMLQLVESGAAQVISNSYGISGEFTGVDDRLLFDQAMSQAAAKGITIAFSSGDAGDNVDSTGTRQADYPATSDLVTALGGTSLYIGKNDNYLGEGYWGTRKYVRKGNGWDSKSTYSSSAGGGVSTVYAEPDWQKGVVPDSYATYGGVAPGRVTPDISLVADTTTGFLVGQTQAQAGGQSAYSEFRIGGTSVSCPLFAAIIADAIELGGGKNVGFINPLLYKNPASPAYRDIVPAKSQVDVVRYDYTDPSDPSTKVNPSIRSLGHLSTLHLRKGYDDATGLGTPYAPLFVPLIAKG